ncbi:unnamed protein product [Cuscuta campestris]|uniref:Uncharacterized protein n=1 Tax=Cuscuta campestris TaxID=132261 RepID=A0A484LWY0_9ASTE|nr:unnamed protein product [Cuscuta campestris]
MDALVSAIERFWCFRILTFQRSPSTPTRLHQGALSSAVAFAVGEAFSVLTLEHHWNRHLPLPRSLYSMSVATWRPRSRSRAEEAAKEETEFQRRLVRWRTGIFCA